MKPKIFIFCNCCEGSFGCHDAAALSEDGHFLAGHSCSNHGFISHDMGITSDWKHEKYAAHYPQGYELVYVDIGVEEHAGISAAYAKHQAKETA